MTPDINEVLNFLSQYAAGDLAALRRKHPASADVLLPNHFGVADQALEIRAQASLLALRQMDRVIARGLGKAVETIAAADRLDDWASLTTALGALCSAFVALADAPSSLKIGAALFTFVSSAVALLAKRRRRSLFAKDISEHIKTLSAAQVVASTLRNDLNAYLSPATPKTYDAKVTEALASVNTLMKSINLAMIDLGLESLHA
jgi:hypothetical protein